MVPTDANDFMPVNFEKDRERAFADLVLQPVLVTAWTTSSKPIFFQAQGSNETGFLLALVEGDAMAGRADDDVEVLFSLDDGQYYWKTKIVTAWVDRWTLQKGGELSRLQRRNNFRTTLPAGYKANLLLKALKTRTLTPTPLALVDVSAGGVRLRWPNAGLAQPAEGDSLSGVLTTPGGRQIDVFGIIKSVTTDASNGEVQVGVEFQNVSGRDEQALLHLCLQIRREFTPK